MFVIHANLDCEARWAGGALPGTIANRVSYYAALVAALAPGTARDVEVWAPAAVDARRLVTARGWTPPAMRVGTPPRADLAWASEAAKAANDRRLALAVAAALGRGLPGARTVASLADLDAAIAELPVARWVVKAPWTTAGRDRCHGEGSPRPDQRTRITRLLERFGALVLEPWLDRVLDVGMCATVDSDGGVSAEPAHGLLTDARGTFLGIELDPPALTGAEHDQLTEAARAAGAALARVGHVGPFAIDAFAYEHAGARRFHPLCEINARYTFGWVARALHRRLGVTRLGFSSPPAHATVLIAPASARGGRDDGVTAWIA